MICKKHITKERIVINLDKLFQIGFIALMLGGCQTIPATYNFTPDYVAPSGHQIHAQLQSIVVTTAAPGEGIGEMPEASELAQIAQEWKRALSVALVQSKNFKSKSNNKVNLIVKILKIENEPITPLISQQSTTYVTARYQIVEVGTGKIIYRNDISSRGVGLIITNGGGIFGQFKKIDMVTENTAIRLNIENLIKSLNDDY